MNNPSFQETIPLWWRIGLLSFGGPAAQIALMHRMVVDERQWLTEQEYTTALSFCMLLPGPEAMQLATYSGWKMHGVAGGLLAGLMFVLPGAAIVLAFAALYVQFGQTPALEAIFLGIKAAVLIIVIEALRKVAGRGLKRRLHWVIAGATFVGLFFFSVPFPLIIVIAAVLGFITSTNEGTDSAQNAQNASTQTLIPWWKTLRTVLIWSAIWVVPLVLVASLSGQSVLTDVAVFFSKLATVTFGGAYAVLAYMTQDAVQTQGWLTTAEMIDGLGLAETTPGPLILVTEFVGFLAGARASGTANIGLGLAAAGVTLWATFAPCFLWVFTGAPYIKWLGTKPKLNGALQGISAAVVGVILNLSIWFALHVLFTQTHSQSWGMLTILIPQWSSISWIALAIMAFAAVRLVINKRGVLVTLATCAAAASVLSGIASQVALFA